ncbi:MAG: hypothetical protein LUG85_08300 [Clostridiales bacterium]|nr:hypothetical protein [Clostridiales bacterium]MCD7828512.1 hypothetical protein [Clostridiales bacterium]
MKHFRKAIAVFLTVLMLGAMMLPVTSFAYENVEDNDHTTFEEFWDMMTDDEGNVDWTQLPKVLLKAFVAVRFFEVLFGIIRQIFGLSTSTDAETTTVAAEEVTAA